MALSGLTGFPASSVVPGVKMQLHMAQGESAAPAGARHALYVAPMLSTGTAQVNQPIQVKSSADAATLFGDGSKAFRTVAAHFATSTSGRVYVLPYADTDGTAADGYISFSGTATAAGFGLLTIVGEQVGFAISVGDTPTVIAANAKLAVNARTHLPVTADSSAEVLTLTSKQTGAETGDGTTGVYRFRVSVPSSTGVSTIVSGAALGLGDGTPGADGSTTEAALLAAALSTVANQSFYYVTITGSSDIMATAVSSHVANKNAASSSRYCTGLMAMTGLAATARTRAKAFNTELLSIYYQPDSEDDLATIVATATALRQRYESQDSAFNMTGLRSNLKPCYLASSRLDDDALQDLLVDGVTPINSDESGTYFVRWVTTRSKDQATGTTNDQRAAEQHRVSVCHEFMDQLKSRVAVTYSSFKLDDDPRLPNGNIDFSKKRLPGVLYPSALRKMVLKQINDYANNAKLKTSTLETIKEAVRVEISDSNTSRVEVELNLDVINIVNQVAARVNEVSKG